jgi:ribA/ribD-fused uncharacterized protein
VRNQPLAQVVDRFVGDYAFLSNFAACLVGYGDPGEEPVTYRSAGHAFQAAKTTNDAQRGRLAQIGSPLTAKQFGSRVELRRGWSEMRTGVMHDLLRRKFESEPFRSLLLATGDAEIVEGNSWHDQLWGDCTCPEHASTPGENLLGRLIMDVRRELRRGERGAM